MIAILAPGVFGALAERPRSGGHSSRGPVSAARMSQSESQPDGAAVEVLDGSDVNSKLKMLMLRYQQADPDAVDELVRTVNPVLSRFLFALTPHSQLVEDLLQDCWLRVHKARQSYHPGEPVMPWIIAIARHTRVDQYRKWKRSSGRESSLDVLVNHPTSDPRESSEDRLRASGILNALEGLPDGQREVLMMLKLGGMSVEDVALATNSTSAAVKQKAYRAYQAVRQSLGLHEVRGGESK